MLRENKPRHQAPGQDGRFNALVDQLAQTIYHFHMNCCGDPAGSVTELFNAALGRPHWRAPAAAGKAEDLEQHLRVEIHLEIEDSRIRRIDYLCTTCASLIAYCEALVRMSCGRGVAEAARLGPGDLIRLVRGVPAYRHDRAHLAAAALQQALQRNPPPTQRSQHK